jgi:exodeoxyribonuclease V
VDTVHETPKGAGGRMEEIVTETSSCGLTDDQRRAVSFVTTALTEHGQAVLGGYAGTGKTYTVGHIVSDARSRGLSVLVVAPTHKALAQVRARLPGGVETATAHRALGLRVVDSDDGTQGATPTQDAMLPFYDLVVVDEASMISSAIYEGIQRERGNARVLWVGDPAQLPPVGETESPVFARVAAQVRLTEVVRQAQDSGILALSLRIRQRIERGERVTIDDVREHEGADLQVMQGGTAAVATLTAGAMRAGCVPLAIAWTNAAVESLTQQIRAQRRGGDTRPYVPGDRVTFGRPYRITYLDGEGEERYFFIHTSTCATVLYVSPPQRDHRRVDCVSLCLLLDESGERIDVTAPLDRLALATAVETARRNQGHYNSRRRRAGGTTEDERAFRLWRSMHYSLRDSYADLRDMYASTAHKAQGSTVDAAVIHWDDCSKNPDAAEAARLLYVAITRASRFLVVVHS